MDCRDFENQLDAFKAGMLSVQERNDFQMHERICAGCHALYETVCGTTETSHQDLGEETVQAILRHTAGPACHSAEHGLCEWIDGDLEEDDRQILALHLEHCSDCRALAASLAELKEALPEIAILQPDEQFTARVLRATSGRKTAVVNPGQVARIADLWSRMIRRPRFAWEAAYVGALLLLLTLGNPVVKSQFLPSALRVSQTLLESSQEVFQLASLRIEKRGEAAQRSLYSLGQQGRQLWNAAAEMQDHAATTFLENTSSWLEELRHSWPNGDVATPQKLNRH